MDEKSMTIPIYHTKLTVTEASIDVLGHVNNREYLRWMEELAIAHSTANGWSQERYLSEGHVWVAREHWIEYLRPALLDEELDLFTWIHNIVGSVSLRRYAVLRRGKLLANAATEWAHIDFATKRLSPLPDALNSAFIVIPENSELLRENGISRPVHWYPVGCAPTP